MAYQEPEQKTPPGQPEVTRFRKASDRRTLIVSLLSLVPVIALASGGDRFLSALKRGDEKDLTPRRPPPGQCCRSVRIWAWTVTRLACSGGEAGKRRPCQSERPATPVLPPGPPALNKAAALADGLNSGSTGSGDNTRTSEAECAATQKRRADRQPPRRTHPVSLYWSVAKMDACAARIRQHRQAAITTTIRALPASPVSGGWASIPISISRWIVIFRVR